MPPISNVELMLLQLVAECRQASGYDVKKLVEQRGYRNWANIGTTSIYAGLKKLSEKGWIAAATSGGKSGKGPQPTRYVLTEAGTDKLKKEVMDSLSTTRERDNRFDLGLAAMPLIGRDEAVAALQRRMDMLREASAKIRQRYEAQGGDRLPPHVRALFRHPISLIESELTFVSRLISEWLEENGEHDPHD